MKKAFTMLELIFVIVVMGIIIAVVTPNTRSNPAAEAAVELQSQIRYAQHLAMVDDQYDGADANWFKNRWQVVIDDNNLTIQSENGTVFASDTLATDRPLSRDYEKKYGVTVSSSDTDCPMISGVFYLSFDHIGRPLIGDLNDYATPLAHLLTNNCTITIAGNGVTVTVDIMPETGFVKAIF